MESTRRYACYLAMVVVQLAYGGSNIVIKIALDKGLNQIVFVVYRHLISMFMLGPLAYLFERKQRPSLSFKTFMKIFVLASIGTTVNLNFYYAGLNYTSPTVASALNCVIPSFTFILSILLGMEKVVIRSTKGRAKVLGTLICISGALIFTFWKGGYSLKSFTAKPLIDIYNAKNSVGSRHHKTDHIKGSALILTGLVAWSAWLILQAIVYEVYPAPLSLNTLICFIASLQSSLLSPFFHSKAASWKLEWNAQLLSIIYCGLLNSGLVYYLQTWVISEKGPVFPAMFSPLGLVIVGIFSSIAFAERLSLGSLIGALLIIAGLYCVLWGKSKDIRIKGDGKNYRNHETLDISTNNDPDTVIVPITNEKK